jgi:hypothetical protein
MPECVVALRGLKLRAKHAVLSNGSPCPAPASQMAILGTITPPFANRRHKIGLSIPIGGNIGNHALVERDFLDLAWHMAQID